jgi:adenosylcobyric acid synthase
LEGRPEGAVSADGKIIGCYVHGLFAADDFRHDFLSRIKAREISSVAYDRQVETVLDQLADHLERHLDIPEMMRIAGLG